MEDCENPVTLSSPTDDFMSGELMMFITNMRATLSNRTNNGSELILDARAGTELLEGFEVNNRSTFTVYKEGCDE